MKALGKFIVGTRIKTKEQSKNGIVLPVPSKTERVIPLKVISVGKDVKLWTDGTVVDTILINANYADDYGDTTFIHEDYVVGEIK